MNTPTPTSNLSGGLDAAPPGFPDLATLNRLAGEFFAAAATGREPNAGPAPHSPQDLLTVAARVPSLAPAAQAPNGVPDAALEALPALGRVGTPALSVPEAYSPPVPLPPPPQAPPPLATPLPVGAPVPSASGSSVPASPYYFIDGNSAYPGVGSEVALPAQSASLPPVADARVPDAPAPVATPSVPDIREGTQVLSLADSIPAPSLPQPPLPAGAPVPGPNSPYYFLGESSAYPSAAPQPSASAGGIPSPSGKGAGDRGTPEHWPPQPPGPALARREREYDGLPTENELKALLSGADRTPASTQATQPATGSPYYFVGTPVAGGKPYATREQTPQVPQSAHPPFDVNAVRRDFPILQERVNGKPLIWMDNAATTHKPQAVIDRLAYFYAHENSNIHRAAHELAARATDAYEGARNKVARFLGASSAEEIIFVRGATEAINLVAKTWGVQNVGAGDEIIVSNLEHHANIVPWQQLAALKGAKLRVIPVDDSGQILLDEYRKLLNDRTKIVAVTQVSNALGTITPIKDIIDIGHRAGAVVLVDGAQAVSHMRVNVQALDADFYVFSGHKIFGPTGIGVVYGKKAILDDMPPWQGGGNMIVDVTFERTIFQPPPGRFEAGTGNIADAVGLGAALDYVERVGLENIARYEHDLVVYATHGLLTVPGIRLIGTAREKASVVSFVLEGHRNEDIGAALNREGIAVRTGHHCAQPILRRLGVETAVRPSLAFYNTCEEVDKLVSVVNRLARRGVV